MKPKHAAISLALAVAAAFAGGYAARDSTGVASAQATPFAAAPATLAAVPTAPAAGVTLPDFADIVASQGPAVVNISVSGTTRTAAMDFPELDQDSPFREFFRRFRIPAPRGKMPTRGQGSGFIVSPDGVVLTSAHVVADADEVMVGLTDRREFKAKVVGVDKQTDVAVLRIDAKGLPSVKIGDPQKVRVGDWVLAIGAPFGFDNSVTAGIVSAKSRTLGNEGYVPFMQTDVAINPGNSGGPLFNTRGEVIGVNSQIFSRSGGYQGLSFAIPIDVAMDIERQLLTKGKVTRGRLGIMIQDVNQELANSFSLDGPKGALVASVEPGSPAARAGVQPGDVVLKFNGRDIGRSTELPPLVAGTAPGSQASVGIWRQGKAKELRITVGEIQSVAAKDKPDEVAASSSAKLGLALRPLRDDEKTEVEAGLIVEQVNDGPAAQAGIRRGDVILAINGVSVSSVDRLSEKVRGAGKNVALLVKRGERRMFVPIRMG